jgi:hypothetical protein
MTIAKQSEAVVAPSEHAPAEEATAVSGDGPRDAAIDRLLDHVHHVPEMAEARRDPAPVAPALRTARVVAVNGNEAQIAYRGRGAPVTAVIDEGVDRALVTRAMAGNEAVLVEVDPEVGPVIVGVVQTRIPDEVEIKARKVVLDADEELLLRAGRGALRIREDGDVELVGSRISTLSRGLFRIVGRVLRLN